MVKINASISFDKKLYEKDILASKVHAQMLSNQNIITKHEENKIIKALDEIQKEIKNNKMKFKNEMEDIHTHIENRLIELVGSIGEKIAHSKI